MTKRDRINNTVKNGQDLSAEIAQYKDKKFYLYSGHWTSHWLFASRERHWLSTEIEKIRFYNFLSRYISNKSYFRDAKVLIAPIGTGDEAKFLQGLYRELHGVDISEIALSECPKHIKTKKTDILHSGYEDKSFDIVLCPSFLHHVHRVGFQPFIAEYYRILRPGGTLAIQEPSSLYPVFRFMSFLRRFMGNVTGLVPDERPIYPPKITRILKDTGFINIKVRGLHFNHVRFPTFLQLTSLLLDWPWRVLWPFKLFSNGIGWYYEKPK